MPLLCYAGLGLEGAKRMALAARREELQKLHAEEVAGRGKQLAEAGQRSSPDMFREEVAERGRTSATRWLNKEVVHSSIR